MPAMFCGHKKLLLAAVCLGSVLCSGCGSTTGPGIRDRDASVSPASSGNTDSTIAEPDIGVFELVADASDSAAGKWTFAVQDARTATSVSVDEYRFNWDFGDGSTSEGLEQAHTFSEAGAYSVKVTALRPDSSVAFVLTVGIVVESDTIELPGDAPVAPAEVDPVTDVTDAADDEPIAVPEPVEPVETEPILVTPIAPPEPGGGGGPPPSPGDPCTADTDQDLVMDCNDGCPNDPRKGAPGICGCGVTETDSDNDATPNCVDGCPNDSQKVAAGACGCGVADADDNHNGVADCLDSPTTGAAVGVNVAKLYGWASQIVFVDAFKQGRYWESLNTTGGSVTSVVVPVDANGYPLEIPYSDGVNPPQMVRTVVLDVEAGTYPTGTYTLIFEGNGDIQLGRAASGTHSSTGAQRTVSVSVTNNTSGISLTITRSNAANPIRNIHVVMPGYLATYATQPFYPPLVSRLQGFGVIRFMEWIRTNGQRRLVTWADRPTADFVTNAGPKGGAYEYAIRLANAVGADSWLTVPHLADDNFIRQLARLTLAELGPGRKAYIEYSNELWNGTFDQTTYVRDTGLALGLSTNSTTAGRRYTAKRSAEIFRIFEEEFGAQSNRLVKVLAGQAGSAGVATEILSTFGQSSVNGVPVNPWGVTAGALAIAPYFGNGLADEIVTNGEVNTITVSQILDRAEQIYLPQALSRVAANKTVADTYGLPLISYEGGQHIVATGSNQSNATLTQKLHDANRDPRMYDVYRAYLDGWTLNGGTLFVHYSFCEGWDQYGSWGAMEYLDQPLAQTPKYQALLDAMQP